MIEEPAFNNSITDIGTHEIENIAHSNDTSDWSCWLRSLISWCKVNILIVWIKYILKFNGGGGGGAGALCLYMYIPDIKQETESLTGKLIITDYYTEQLSVDA